MSIEKNSNEWINLVYEQWFSKNEACPSYMRESTKKLVKRMKVAAKDPSRADEAWNLLERLKRLSENFQKSKGFGGEDYAHEQAEIYLECALTAYKMGDLNEAQNLMLHPVGQFPRRSLHRALSHWLYGCMLWLLPARIEDAIYRWELSLQTMREVKVDYRRSPLGEWCATRENEMQTAVVRAAEQSFPPSPEEIVGAGRYRDYPKIPLAFLSVTGEIPAGTPAGMLPSSGVQISSDIVQIEGQAYGICGLGDEKRISLVPSRQYFALKVVGESMNKSTPVRILNKDYVLLKAQATAENGDIVAAEIVGLDNRATLKRYAKEGDAISLIPESNDPRFQSPIYLEREFTEFDDDFSIRGVAIAVFKKITN